MIYFSYRVSWRPSESRHTMFAPVSLFATKSVFSSDSFLAFWTPRSLVPNVTGYAVCPAETRQTSQTRVALNPFAVTSGPASATFTRPVLRKKVR